MEFPHVPVGFDGAQPREEDAPAACAGKETEQESIPLVTNLYPINKLL